MNIEKVKTYVGFAIRSGTIVYGVDTIVKKRVDLIVYGDELAAGSKAKLVSLSQEINCPIKEIQQGEVDFIIGGEGVKAFAIKNNNLAKAILENI